MERSADRLRKIQLVETLALPTLTVLLGAQTLRVLLPRIVHYLGVQPGVGTITMGLFAFGVFLTAFLAAPLHRLLRLRGGLALTAGGLAVVRLLEQLSATSSVDLVLVTVGTVLFLFFLPIYLGSVRGGGAQGTTRYAIAIILGLALDTGLHGVLGTYDLSWQPGIVPLLVVLVIVVAQLILVARAVMRPDVTVATEGGFLATLPLLGLLPFLFLQGLIFQNVARATAMTGWAQPLAFAWVVLANAAALARAAVVAGRQTRGWWWWAPGLGLLLILVTAWSQSGLLAAVFLFAGQVASTGLLVMIFAGLGERADRSGLWRTSVAFGIGSFLFALLAFAYYVVYDLDVPYSNAVIPPLAAAILALCAIGATRLLPAKVTSRPVQWVPLSIALALLLFPLVSWATWSVPHPVAGDGFPVRVITYNLHMGFDTDGHLGMENLARVIEESEAEVVGLQEVCRGWYITSSLDMLTWLSRRLDMPYLSGPTAGPLWGNAILSRYPIVEHGSALLPTGGKRIQRGYLWARIDVGAGEELLMVDTHLHDPEDEGHVREIQVPPILEFWAGRPSTVIVGDFNAGPSDPEIEMILDAGLQDSFAEIGSGPGYTYASNDPQRRIDYIWSSPDLSPSDLDIPESTASDHLGVVVTIER
jgi:endonuclease/exonuclease/phosphatase family metal-dependent hydrolase